MAKITFHKHSHNLSFKCPVCGHLNEYNQMEKRVGKDHEIIHCDNETGGCDQTIVLESNVSTSIQLKAMKIDGIEYEDPNKSIYQQHGESMENESINKINNQ